MVIDDPICKAEIETHRENCMDTHREGVVVGGIGRLDWYMYNIVHFSSVAQSCPTLWDPMDFSMPGFPVHHQLSEPTQIHIHHMGDTIHHLILCLPLLLLPSIFPSSGSFPMSWFFTSGGQIIGVSALASVLPMNIQDWFPLGLIGWISLQSKGLSRVSSIPQFKSINSSALSFLYSPALTSIHDHWKNHSFDETDLCWQSKVSAF